MPGWAAPFGAALLVLAAGCADRVAACQPELVVERWPTGERLARLRPDPAQTFRLAFRHSVSLTEVVDIYRIEHDRILLVGEIFETHGAGLPSTAGDGVIRAADGRFHLSIVRAVDPLILRPRIEYENRLIAAEAIDLTKWHGEALRLRSGGCGVGGKEE